MMGITKRRSLPFLLGIGLLICVTEGFVGLYRIIPVTTQRIPEDDDKLLSPTKKTNHGQHPLIASSLHASVQEQQSQTQPISVGSVRSHEIHEMASFVCARLYQTVMVKAMSEDENDGEPMDIEAFERLTSAFHGLFSDEEEEENASSVYPAAVESDESTAVAPELEVGGVEELHEETPPMRIEPTPSEATSFFDEEEETTSFFDENEESITGNLVESGWGENHAPPLRPFREEEVGIYPEGSVDLPRAAPKYEISPLEVVALNVAPLRPESIPRKEPPLSVSGDEDTTLFIEKEEPKPLEVLEPLEEKKIGAFLDEEEHKPLEVLEPEKIETFLKKETDTIFDASKVWDLDQIMASAKGTIEETSSPQQHKEGFSEKEIETIFDASKAWDLNEILDSTKGIVEEITTSKHPNGEELIRRKLLQERLKMDATKMAKDSLRAEELFRRKLMQTRLEMIALMDASSEDEAASICDFETRSEDEKTTEKLDVEARCTADELFHRSLLKRRIEYEKAAATAARNAIQQKDEELLRRELLKLQLQIVARDSATSQAVEERMNQEEVDEMFQRRLLAKKFEFDLAALKIKTKKADELFRRQLLQKNLEYEIARIEKELFQSSIEETMNQRKGDELFQRRLLAKKFEFDFTALETKRKKADELFRRKLLQKNIECEAARMQKELLTSSSVSKKYEFASMAIEAIMEERDPLQKKSAIMTEAVAGKSDESPSVPENENKDDGVVPFVAIDEMFQRRLLAKKFEYNVAALEIKRKKADELFRRKLLQKNIEYEVARMQKELLRSSIEETRNQKKRAIETESVLEKSVESLSVPESENTDDELIPSVAIDELFQRRLLAKKLEFDSVALEIERKKADELFRRQLLAKKFEFEFAKLETTRKTTDELLCRNILAKNLEYEAARSAIETNAITEESIETLSIPETENIDDELVPFVAVDELKMEIQDEEVLESTKSTESVYQESIDVPDDENSEYIQPEVQDSDFISTPDEWVDEWVSYGDNHQNSPRDDWVSSLPTVSQQRYAKEAKISHSFKLREFNPTKWSTNNHFQTIVGTLFREETMYSRGENDAGIILEILGVGKISDKARMHLDEFQWDKRIRVETTDGDFYVADWKYAKGHENHEEENPVCLICHGLESCSDSPLAKEIAIACNGNGIDTACINFRGCQDSGEECNLTTRAYHMGFTDDLLQQIEEVHSKNPNRRIYLSGFSLGAGVVTNLLTKLGPKAYEYNICGAAVNAVPFDTVQHHMAINGPGFTRTVYGDRLLKSMKTRMGNQYDQCGFEFDRSELDKCETIMDVENLVICPVFGFDDAFDYYNKVKTIDKLHKVCVPQFVIQARDDPFFRGLEEVSNDEGMPLRIQYTDCGGHCGYILHQREPDEENCKTSWMPRQLARFFAHIEEERRADN